MIAPPDSFYSSQPLLMRILIRRFVYRRPKVWGALCLAASLWLLFLGGVLCIYGFWWGAALLAIGALEIWVGYRLLFVVQS